MGNILFKKLPKSLMVVPLAALLVACGSESNEEAAEGDSTAEDNATEEVAEETTGDSITVTDSLGREVVIDGPVETVVAEQPSQAEIIYGLGQEEKLVGRGSYVDYPAEVQEVPDVGSGEEINYEEIIQLEPDVFFVGLMGDPDQEFSQLEEAGIAVVAVHAETLDGVYETIELMGTVLDSNDQADSLIEEMQGTFAEFEEMADQQVAEGEEPSVYYEISPLEFGLWTAGTETFMDEIGEILNMENIFEDVPGFGEVSEEQVVDRNPDYIITTSMESEGFDPVEEILDRGAWQDIAAVENQNVYMANSDEFTRPGPRLMDAVETLYNFVYGDQAEEEVDEVA